MLHGSLVDKLLLFAMPLAVTGILQQLFNAADVAIVGRFVGSDAMAAVGSNAPIIGLLVNLFIGISLGANVVISRCTGQGNAAANRKVVGKKRAGTSVPQPVQKLPHRRSIEIIGDSVAAGAFIYPEGDYFQRESGYLAFGPRLARMHHHHARRTDGKFADAAQAARPHPGGRRLFRRNPLRKAHFHALGLVNPCCTSIEKNK